MKKKISILFFSILFCLVFSSVGFAVSVADTPEGLYPLPEISQEYTYSEHILYSKSNGDKFVTYFYSNEPFTIDSYVLDDYSTQVILGNVVRVQTFKYMGTYWGDQGSRDTDSRGMEDFYTTTIYNSTYNIRESQNSNEIFFTAPPETEELYQTIHRVTEQGLETRLTLAGTIRILVLCGVGLIALLMVLNLFGKVFNHYRS